MANRFVHRWQPLSGQLLSCPSSSAFILDIQYFLLKLHLSLMPDDYGSSGTFVGGRERDEAGEIV